MNFTKKGKTCHGTPASRRAEFGDFTGGNLLAALLWLNVRRGTAHSLALLWQVVFECSPAIVTGEMKSVWQWGGFGRVELYPHPYPLNHTHTRIHTHWVLKTNTYTHTHRVLRVYGFYSGTYRLSLIHISSPRD